MPFFLCWLIHFDGVEGSKPQVFQHLTLVAHSGHYFGPFAKILLATGYLREGQPRERARHCWANWFRSSRTIRSSGRSWPELAWPSKRDAETITPDRQIEDEPGEQRPEAPEGDCPDRFPERDSG
jgi:hypothetical protein